MEGAQNQTTDGEPAVPVQIPRGLRGFKPFRNPPQPHMCILTYIKDTVEKIYINVLGWKQIANPKHHTDPIPLYGGMQIPQGYAPNSDKGPLLVFAVMVNPEILKINGKNAANKEERDAFVNLLCEFVEAMNPNLRLTGKASVLKDRDFAGELKDVWVAVQTQREREKIRMPNTNSDVTHKIYHIDGPSKTNLNQSSELNAEYAKGLNRDSTQDRKPTEFNSKSCDKDSQKRENTSECHSSHNQLSNHQINSFPDRIITDEIESLDRRASNSNNICTEFSNKAFSDNIVKNNYNLNTNHENLKMDTDENRRNSSLLTQTDASQTKNIPSHSNNIPLSNISNLAESISTVSCQNDRLKENGNSSKQMSSTSHIPIKLPNVKRKIPKPSDTNTPSKNFYPIFDNPVAKPETEKATSVSSVAIDEKKLLNPIIPREIKSTENKSTISINDENMKATNITVCKNSESKQMTINNSKNASLRPPVDKQINMNVNIDQNIPSDSDMVKYIEKLNLAPHNSSETAKNSWNNSTKEPQTTLSSK